VYGVENAPADTDDERGADAAEGEDSSADTSQGDGNPRLVEPMLVTRTGAEIPEYDLRDVDRTVIVRVTESEFGA